MTKSKALASLWVSAVALFFCYECFRFFSPYLTPASFFPFGPWNLRFIVVWSVHLFRLFGVVAFLGSCFALGKHIFPGKNISVPLRAGVGLIAWSFLGFILTACGLAITTKLQAIAPIIFIVVLYLERYAILNDVKSIALSVREFFHPISFPAIAILGFIVLGFFATMTPEIFADTLHYVLPVPQAYLRAGHFVDMPGQVFTRFPRLPSMICIWGLAWGDDRFCKLINFGIGFIWAWAIGEWSARLWGRRAGMWAAAFLLGCPMIAGYMWIASNDIFCGLFAFLAFESWLLAWSPDNRRGQPVFFALAGLMLGAAAASKYVALFVAPFFAVDIVGRWLRGEKSRRSELALFAGGALLPLVPWWALNAVWTGNPFYPYLARLGGVDNLQAALLSFMRDDFRQTPEFWNRLALPIILSVKGVWFSRDGFIGPVLLMFCPFAVLWREMKEERESIGLAALFFIVTWICFAFAAGKLRYLMPGLGVAFALAGAAMARCEKKMPIVFFASAAVLLVQFICLALAFHLFLKGGEILSGRWSAEEYVRTDFGRPNFHPSQKAFDFLASEGVGPPDKVYLIGETRSFRCPGDAYANSLYDVPLFVRWRQSNGSADAAVEQLRHDGFRYVLINRPLVPLSVMPQFRTDDWTVWLEEVLKDLGRPAFNEAGVEIYKIPA